MNRLSNPAPLSRRNVPTEHARPASCLQSFAADAVNDDDLNTIVGYLSILGTGDAVAWPGEADAAPVVLDADSASRIGAGAVRGAAQDPARADQIALGKYLFFDQRLSGNNSLELRQLSSAGQKPSPTVRP